jgi:uncharacterized protein YjbJ (UPF0337 family)
MSDNTSNSNLLNSANGIVGSVKEATGHVLGNKDLEARGKHQKDASYPTRELPQTTAGSGNTGA